ncbi:PAS domain S-box protein [Natronolimnohabitans innermongolicus]|uniref:histidine kinase n=1 Tax=Natronolimnohabitans innermongolicus JCM 12255 TaxID=1227499 RepID=L9XDW3_9EURY|nr:PAS domain S-box protein [Natronolimnohabitans innermongolicus]ELY59910.1 putative signal-transducing histidine kinase / response regulator [Natronolimnohabitans innermongolicus JCM 12255]
MSRPRILCVSSDRSTRASITRSLTDVPVNVVIAQRTTAAVDRLERDSIDGVVIDANTVANVPRLVDAVESEGRSIPTFVHWGADDRDASVSVLSEVVARADGTAPSNRLAEAVAERVGADSRATPASANAASSALGGRVESGPESEPESDGTLAALPDDLAAVVSAARRRLVDVTSPVAVERILREEFTATDRFAFAWVGEYDQGEREIVPWLTDPDSMAWPMQRTFAIGDGEQPLLERAVRTDELQTRQGIADGREAVPFGDHAFERGVRSVAVAPLRSSADRYGVFVVYALESLTDAEREAIRSVAAAAAHVLETIAVRGRLVQRERALERYERLVETAGDGMYVLDEQGHFMTVNDALVEMTGYSREGLLGEHVSLVFDPDGVDAGRDVIRSLLSSDATTDTAELTLETKAGERIPCEVQIAIFGRGDEFVGSVGVVRDVTERKRSERKLREQNERLDAFARIVSHDLRNPLGVAQGYLDLLEDTGSIEHAENVRDGLDRMEAIVEDVLAIARDGEWASDLESVDLESVAEDAWEYVSTADASLSVTETITLEADRSRLLRLLENLFRNSVEHGGAGVSVQIGPLRDDAASDRRGFYVADDGDGLPESIRDELFDPAVSSSSEGLGIGLWVVREVATGHGWSVAATESDDGGARFEFAFDGEGAQRD